MVNDGKRQSGADVIIGTVGWYFSEMNKIQEVVIIILKST